MADRHRCQVCYSPMARRWGACDECQAGLTDTRTAAAAVWHRGGREDLTAEEREALLVIYAERAAIGLPLFTRPVAELLGLGRLSITGDRERIFNAAATHGEVEPEQDGRQGRDPDEAVRLSRGHRLA